MTDQDGDLVEKPELYRFFCGVIAVILYAAVFILTIDIKFFAAMSVIEQTAFALTQIITVIVAFMCVSWGLSSSKDTRHD